MKELAEENNPSISSLKWQDGFDQKVLFWYYDRIMSNRLSAQRSREKRKMRKIMLQQKVDALKAESCVLTAQLELAQVNRSVSLLGNEAIQPRTNTEFYTKWPSIIHWFNVSRNYKHFDVGSSNKQKTSDSRKAGGMELKGQVETIQPHIQLQECA